MQITHAALTLLQEQRKVYEDRLKYLKSELESYYENHGHTNHDWLDTKIARLEAEKSGFVEAARIMGIDIR